MKILLAILSGALLLGAIACTCRNVECASIGYKNIVYLSKTDSTNLFTSHQYDPSDVIVTPLLNNTTGSTPHFEADSLASAVYLESNDNTLGYILQLDNFPADTILFYHGSSDDQLCCPDQITIDQISINGILLPAGRYDYDLYLLK